MLRLGFVAIDWNVHVPKVRRGLPETGDPGQADRSRPTTVRERSSSTVGHCRRRLPTVSGTAVQLSDTAVLLSTAAETNFGEAATG